MKYDNEELLNLLAGEYALGALRGPARLRFERILEDSPAARDHLRSWEAYFAVLANNLDPVSPPPGLWPRIHAAIDPDTRAAPTDKTSSKPPADEDRPRPSWWHSSGLWQGVAAVLVVSLLVVAITKPAPVAPPTQAPPVTVASAEIVALMESAEGDDLWLLRAIPELSQLDMQALATLPLDAAQAYELWMIPDGGSPVSLGLLPLSGETRVSLSAQQLSTLEASSALAVSLEPAGGSPTGQPTGPVLYTAPLIKAPS